MSRVDVPLPEIQYLQGVALFRGNTPAELRSICQLARSYSINQGEFFFHQDDPATILYVLTAGQVKLTQISPDGHQVLVRFVHPGEDFGAIATLTGATYPLSAQAVENCVAEGWDQLTVKRLLIKFPRITMNALHLIADRFVELQERYRELATERVERRVARALLRLAEQSGRNIEAGLLLDLSLQRQDLAEMTGTTLYTVSRILSGWEREGLVEVGRGRIVICHHPGLEAIAEDLPPTPLSQFSA